jgi:hypothetical protein
MGFDALRLLERPVLLGVSTLLRLQRLLTTGLERLVHHYLGRVAPTIHILQVVALEVVSTVDGGSNRRQVDNRHSRVLGLLATA